MKRELEGRPFCDTMKKVIKVMSEGPWCLIGGRAVEVYSNPPQTPDADILCEAYAYDIPKVIKEYKSLKIVLVESYSEDAIVQMIDKDTGIEVDVMPTYDKYEIRAIKQANDYECGKVVFPVALVEDLVILKAAAACSPGGGLMGRSQEKKLRDAKAIYHLNKENDLDKKYILKVLEAEHKDCELNFLKKLRVL